MKFNLQKFLILGIFLYVFSFYYSYSQDVSTLQNQINDRNNQIKNLQAEIDAYTNQVASTEEEAKTLKSAITNLFLLISAILLILKACRKMPRREKSQSLY